MDWFKRIKEGITTKTDQKKEMADGLWIKCPKCKIITSRRPFNKSLGLSKNVNIIIELVQRIFCNFI